MSRRTLGLLVTAGFIATIPLANWTLDRYGFIDLPWLGPVASGVVWVGLAFVLRDIAQLLLGRVVIIFAIAIGALLSWWLASSELATASAVAFGLSELLDYAIYTPLADRRFTTAVIVSSMAGACLDSILFLWIAFDSTDGWWQLAVVKTVIVLLATPAATASRSALQPA